MTNLRILITLFALLLIISGCQSTTSKTYTRYDTHSPMTVYLGTILQVEDVVIQERQTGAGAISGGVAGGVIGSTIGNSHHGNPAGFIIGSLVGAGVGAATEMAATTRSGVEIEVAMDDGRIVVIVQERDGAFVVGDRVRVLQSSDGRMRVRQ